MSLRLEEATAALAADIGYIHAESWKQAYRGALPDSYLDNLLPDRWIEGFARLLGSGETAALVLFRDGCAVGCVSYGVGRDDDLPGWGEVPSLYLLPGETGRGYGRTLMEEAVAKLKAAGYAGVYVHVLASNHAARGFYAHVGMTLDEQGAKQIEIADGMYTTQRYVMAFDAK